MRRETQDKLINNLQQQIKKINEDIENLEKQLKIKNSYKRELEKKLQEELQSSSFYKRQRSNQDKRVVYALPRSRSQSREVVRRISRKQSQRNYDQNRIFIKQHFEKDRFLYNDIHKIDLDIECQKILDRMFEHKLQESSNCQQYKLLEEAYYNKDLQSIEKNLPDTQNNYQDLYFEFINFFKLYIGKNTILEECIINIKYSKLKKYCFSKLRHCYQVQDYFKYVKSGNIQAVYCCICKGADPDQIDIESSWKCTALMYCCQYGYLQLAKFLIEQCQVNINKTDQQNNNSFLYACQFSQIKIAIYLLENKVDYRMVNYARQTGLDFVNDNQKQMIQEQISKMKHYNQFLSNIFLYQQISCFTIFELQYFCKIQDLIMCFELDKRHTKNYLIILA